MRMRYAPDAQRDNKTSVRSSINNLVMVVEFKYKCVQNLREFHAVFLSAMIISPFIVLESDLIVVTGSVFDFF